MACFIKDGVFMIQNHVIYLLAILIVGTLYLYIILFKSMRMRKKSVINPNEVQEFISDKQKLQISIVIIFMYLCIFFYAINAEKSIGNGVFAGLKTGALIAVANSFRPAVIFFFINYAIINYQDKQFKKQKKEENR